MSYKKQCAASHKKALRERAKKNRKRDGGSVVQKKRWDVTSLFTKLGFGN